ncbi:MAG: hypothetical protein QXT19_00200 [Candidatus Woesearchaeota archaeon]
MNISVETNGKVVIRFKGKVNMSQEVLLSKADAKRLGEILSAGKSESFETS